MRGAVLARRPAPVRVRASTGYGFMAVAIADDQFGDGAPGATTEAALMASSGLKLLRTDFRQANLGGGSYTTQDALVNAITGAGMTPLGILNPNTDLNTGGERTAYADYCSAVVTRYAGRVKFWSICNEPNMASGTTVLRADYVLALPLAYAAIKAADPTAKVLAGALAGIENDGSGFQGTDEFVQAIYDDASARVAFDGLDLHSYTDSNSLSWDHANDTAGYHTKQIIANCLAIMVAAGDLHRQIYITETGIHTNGAGFTQDWQWLWYYQQNANHLSTATLYNHPRVEHVYGYSSINLAPSDTAQRTYGVFMADLTPKVAQHEIARLANLATAAVPTYEVEKGRGDHYFPLFRRFLDSTSDARANLRYELLGAPAGVTINPSTGIMTVVDATVTAARQIPIIVRAIHRRGGSPASVDQFFYLNVYNPNLLTTGYFREIAGVTGWDPSSANATVTYDAEYGALNCNITGTGGGYIKTTGVTVTTGQVYERVLILRKTDYGGTSLNVFVGGAATTPATINPTTSWEKFVVEIAPAATPATASVSRFGAFTGNFQVRRDILRLK